MSIIVGELFLSACLTPLHHTLSRDTPERSIFHSRGPSNPPLTLTFVHLPAPLSPHSGFHARFFPPPRPCLSKLTSLQGEQVGRLRQAPHLYPETHEFAHGADCQRSCFTDWSGGEGGYDKDDSLCGGTLSAAATRNLFRKNRILYTMVVGVKKGGTY